MALPRYGVQRQAMPVLDHRQSAGAWAPNQQSGDPGFDPNEEMASELSEAERTRTIVSNNRVGTLSVTAGDPPVPFGFVTNYSTLDDGAPVVCLRNDIVRVGRLGDVQAAAFSVADTPLTARHSSVAGGVSLLGTLKSIPELNRHAVLQIHARTHAGDEPAVQRGSAQLFLVSPTAILLTGSGDDVVNVEVRQYRAASPDPLAAVAPGLAAHLTGDQNGSLVLLSRAFGGQPAATSAQLVGIDRLGMDLLATTDEGREPVRLGFTHPVSSPEEVRKEITTMVRAARFKLGVG